MYLTAVIDWGTRYVLSWELSNSLESSFCLKALRESLDRYGKPDIFNTDQGSQYTNGEFTDALLESGSASAWTEETGRLTTSSRNGSGEA